MRIGHFQPRCDNNNLFLVCSNHFQALVLSGVLQGTDHFTSLFSYGLYIYEFYLREGLEWTSVLTDIQIKVPHKEYNHSPSQEKI